MRSKRRGALGRLPGRHAVQGALRVGASWRTEAARSLDVVDFGRNPVAPEFGGYGTVNVRYGKAKRGQPARRRNVARRWGGRSRRSPTYVENAYVRSSATPSIRRCG